MGALPATLVQFARVYLNSADDLPPGIQELEQQARAFASAYHNNPTAVVKLIARSTVSDSVRDFADAFRIKPDDDR